MSVLNSESILAGSSGGGSDCGDPAMGPTSGPSWGPRGLAIGGGQGSSRTNYIGYFDHSTSSSLASWGATIISGNGGGNGGVSNGTRGIYGGRTGDPPWTNFPTLEYVTVATTGTVTAFGTGYSAGGHHSSQGASNGTVGIWNNPLNKVDYVTIATTSNALAWGTNIFGTNNASGPLMSNNIRAIHGATSGYTNTTIEFVTICTPATALSFGNMSTGRDNGNSVANDSIGMFIAGTTGFDCHGGGNPWKSNVIDKITPMTAGNAQSHGNLLTGVSSFGVSTNGTYAVKIAGNTENSCDCNCNTASMEQWSMANGGTASAFGSYAPQTANGTGSFSGST